MTKLKIRYPPTRQLRFEMSELEPESFVELSLSLQRHRHRQRRRRWRQFIASRRSQWTRCTWCVWHQLTIESEANVLNNERIFHSGQPIFPFTTSSRSSRREQSAASEASAMTSCNHCLGQKDTSWNHNTKFRFPTGIFFYFLVTHIHTHIHTHTHTHTHTYVHLLLSLSRSSTPTHRHAHKHSDTGNWKTMST